MMLGGIVVWGRALIDGVAEKAQLVSVLRWSLSLSHLDISVYLAATYSDNCNIF
jgi:hypothetical protein